MTCVKICGLSREADIEMVNEAQPDFIGFVFAPSSRQISFDQAVQLKERLARTITPVGVFIDAPFDFITRLYKAGVIAIAQLHGNEDAAYITALKELCGIPVIKAIPIKNAQDLNAATAIPADYFLFDGGAGLGTSFDWTLLAQAQPLAKPWFLAGGLDLVCLPGALALKPWGLDVSSGVESDGHKDPEKILAFVQAVHAAYGHSERHGKKRRDDHG